MYSMNEIPGFYFAHQPNGHQRAARHYKILYPRDTASIYLQLSLRGDRIKSPDIHIFLLSKIRQGVASPILGLQKPMMELKTLTSTWKITGLGDLTETTGLSGSSKQDEGLVGLSVKVSRIWSSR